MNTEPDLESEAGEGVINADAIDLLTLDHEEVMQLFADYDELVLDGADDDDRVALAEQICDALTAHAIAEEEIFYPAARDALDDGDLVETAIDEHASAHALIAQIRAMDPADDVYDATVRMLQETIEQHVDEEEGELFPRVRESSLDLQSLAEEIEQRKEEVLAELLQGED